MAHFARVVDSQVVRVHLVANQVITDADGVEREELGQQFLAETHGYQPEELIQCSYNGNIRKNYPGAGFTYDVTLDAFIAPQPFPSWVLDEETCRWGAPVAYPENGGEYSWDEGAGDWVEIPGA